MKSDFIALAGAIAIGLSLLQVKAQDWPGLLGPSANGASSEIGLLDIWPTNGPQISWSKKIGTGYGAPSIRRANVIVQHRIGDEEIVESFKQNSGESIWRYRYPSAFVDPYGYNNGPRASPLLTSNRVYTFGAEGKLLCLELTTGNLVWQRDTAREWDIPPAFFGVGSSPILESDRLIVMVGGQPNSGVVALSPENGKTLWESVGEKNWTGEPKTGWPGQPIVKWESWEKQASYSTPVAATINNQRQVLCLTRQGLVSLNPTNGAVNFSFWFRSRANDSVNAMCPVVVDNLILISAAYYKIGSVLLRVKPDNKSVQEIWRNTSLETHWTTPVIDDGFAYAFSGRNEPDAHFRCIEFATGKLMWDRDESWVPHSTATPNVFGRGSCIRADGKLYALGEGGLLGIFKFNPQKVEEVCRFQVPELRYPCWAAPILANKHLYLRSEDRLLCIDIAKH